MNVYVLIREYSYGYEGTDTSVLTANTDLAAVIIYAAKYKKEHRGYGTLEIIEYHNGVETDNYFKV